MTTLRDLIGEGAPPVNDARNEIVDRVTARMPGDPIEDHPLHSVHNPYLFAPHSELKDRLRKGVSSRDEERLIRAALDMQQLQHSDGRPMGIGPQDVEEPEPDPSRSDLRPAW